MRAGEGRFHVKHRFFQGDFAACGRRVSFWMPRKKPKRHQGAAQDERFALIFAAPGPHFTGAQLGSLAVIAKARVAQLTGCPSIAAAAELTVTFGGCSYRWKARLLCGWGSSAAQGIGGRGRTPAPAEYPETRLSLRRGRSQTGPGVPAGGPVCRPYGGNGIGVGSANSGADVESHRPQFSAQPGPSGPAGIETSHPDFARRKCSAHFEG